MHPWKQLWGSCQAAAGRGSAAGYVVDAAGVAGAASMLRQLQKQGQLPVQQQPPVRQQPRCNGGWQGGYGPQRLACKGGITFLLQGYQNDAL